MCECPRIAIAARAETLREQQRRRRVPCVVESSIAHACASEQRFPVRPVLTWVDRPACRLREHITAVRAVMPWPAGLQTLCHGH
jgi:hypothetical protein